MPQSSAHPDPPTTPKDAALPRPAPPSPLEQGAPAPPQAGGLVVAGLQMMVGAAFASATCP